MSERAGVRWQALNPMRLHKLPRFVLGGEIIFLLLANSLLYRRPISSDSVNYLYGWPMRHYVIEIPAHTVELMYGPLFVNVLIAVLILVVSAVIVERVTGRVGGK